MADSLLHARNVVQRHKGELVDPLMKCNRKAITDLSG